MMGAYQARTAAPDASTESDALTAAAVEEPTFTVVPAMVGVDQLLVARVYCEITRSDLLSALCTRDQIASPLPFASKATCGTCAVLPVCPGSIAAYVPQAPPPAGVVSCDVFRL